MALCRNSEQESQAQQGIQAADLARVLGYVSHHSCEAGHEPIR